MLDMMLPLRMDRMHVKEQSETLNISCPQELHGDEADWTDAYPNLYPQSYLQKGKLLEVQSNNNHGNLYPYSCK